MAPPPDHMLKGFAGAARGREALGGGEMKGGKQANDPNPVVRWSFFSSFENSSESILSTFEKPKSLEILNFSCSAGFFFSFPSHVGFLLSFYARSNWYSVEIPDVGNLREVMEYK